MVLLKRIVDLRLQPGAKRTKSTIVLKRNNAGVP
jgi:hypothetical protein